MNFMKDTKKYQAFISYCHADNNEQGRYWATWLHQAIETYEVPSELVGKKNNFEEEIPARIYPIFRDEEELPADADLGKAITNALDSTRLLIVLCSPNAVASTYVAEEIDYFKKRGYSNKIIAAIIDGEPNSSWDKDKQASGFKVKDECFPIPLQYEYDKQGNKTTKHSEPIAADFRINNNGLPEQGWTSIEAYRQHLKSSTNLNSKQIQKKLDTFQKQQSLMLLKIIAGILGTPLGELTKRDKAYQLEQANKKQKRLRRWLKKTNKLLIEANHNYGLALFERSKHEFVNKNFRNSAFYSANAISNIKPSKVSGKAYDLWYNSIIKPTIIWKYVFKDSLINGAILSPKNNVITVFYDENIIFISLLTGRTISKIKTHLDTIECIKYSRDGLLLAAGLTYGLIYIWNTNSNKLVSKLQGHTNSVTSLAFSKNNLTLVSGSTDHSIIIWDVLKKNIKTKLNGHSKFVTSVAFSPLNSDLLISGSNDKTIRYWNLSSNTYKEKYYGAYVSNIVFSKDGLWIAVAFEGKNIQIVNLESEKLNKSIKNSDFGDSVIHSLDFSLDGKKIITGSFNGGVKVWCIKSGQLDTILDNNTESVHSVNYSLDGNLIIAVSDNKLTVWDTTISNLKMSVKYKTFNHGKIQYSLNSEIFLSASKNGGIDIWDINTGFKIKNILNINNDLFEIFSLSPKGLLIASKKLSQNSVQIWHIESENLLFELSDITSEIINFKFSNNNSLIAISLANNTLQIWDFNKNEFVSELTSQKGKITSIDFTDNILMYLLEDQTVRLWNLTDSSNEIIYKHKYLISRAKVSPDYKYIIIADAMDNYLIDLTNTNKTSRLILKNFGTKKITISTDGRTVAIASLLGIIIIDILDENILTTISNSYRTEDLGFIKDSTIISRSKENIHIWDVSNYITIKDKRSRNKWINERKKINGYRLNGLELKSDSLGLNTIKNIPPIWLQTHPFHWLTKAESGDAKAMLQLGLIYHRDSDNEKAKQWYTNALDAGHLDAQVRLNILELTIKSQKEQKETKEN